VARQSDFVDMQRERENSNY